MAKMNGGRAVAAALKAEGVEHVFGIVGTHNSPLFDGAYKDNALQVITVRHEQGATMMAAGYARASGKIAASFVVPGPGLTNALTGMGMAYSESAPMLVFGGQNNLSQLEREGGHFHELNESLSVAAPVCGYTTRVSTPEHIPGVVREAVRTMRSGRPRPAYIELPLDVQSGSGEVVVETPPADGPPAGNPTSIRQAAEALQSASRPFIFAGEGADNPAAEPWLTKLAEQLGAPVVTSMFGRGAISDRHPLALGDAWGRLDIYDGLLAEADLVLIVGTRIDVVSDPHMGARLPGRVVQIDIDAQAIGQRRPVEVGIVGDPALVLAALSASLDQSRQCWFDTETFQQVRRRTLESRCGPVLPLIESLRAAVPDDTIFVDDLTLVGYWMPMVLDTYQPRTLIHPGTYGTLGYSLPAAIGAKLACPGQTVVSISGDGGFMFTVQDLATARALNLDLIALVFNDNAFGAIRTFQDRQFDSRHIGSELVNPDFVKLGEAFGVNSLRIDAAQVGDTVARARESGGTWLIEVPFAPQGSPNVVPWMP